MSEELVSRKELAFQLYEVLDTESLCERERYSEHNKGTFDAVMETADKIAREKFAPHNRKADLNEPTFDGERVHMIPEVKEAFDTYAESGLIAGRFDFEDGGMQLPETIMMACSSYFTSSNPSSTGYSFLTVAAANVIKNFACQSIKDKFMPRMLTGEFTGTMALTEPHAGSSLADITTNAKPAGDGSYRIKGSKMFISAGDHELSDNIVHLVLAKIQGAPPGVKGISLFVVPKYRLDENDQPSQRNDVSLAGLIHKMGYRGTTSTVLSFGEKDDCHGYLVGEEHQGLKYMFLMMNEARLGVGFGAAMLGYAGYRHSLQYAKERTQGRVAPNNKPTDKPATIIQHGDVKRMLLAQKSYVEGGMSLCFYAARLVDDLHTAATPEEKQKTAELLDLLTPVVKAWPSEFGPKANDLAIQILGGSGYTLIADLQPYLGKLQTLIPLIGSELRGENQNALLANASCFLTIFGQIVVSWIWIRQAITAEAALAKGQLPQDDEAFYRGKLQAAKYFIDWELSAINRDFTLLTNMNDSCSAMQEAWF